MNNSQHVLGTTSAAGYPTAPVRAHIPRQALGPPRKAWWDGAPWLALLLIVVAAVRLHELVPALRVLQPVLVTTVGGGALLLVKSPPAARRNLLRHPLMRLVLAYWCFMVLTVPFALWSARAFGMVTYFLPAVVLAAAILSCAPHLRTVRRLHIGFVLALGAYALYVLLLGSARNGRLSAGMGGYDSNDMAALLSIGVPFAAGLVRLERGKLRLLFVAIVTLLVVAVVSSGSRGGALGLGAGAIVFVLGLKGTGRLVGVGMFIASLLLVWTVSPGFQERMVSLTNLDEDYNTTHEYGREAVWERGRQYIRENPVIGVGAGNFPMAEGDYFAEAYSGLRGGKWSAAHNSYIQAYAELGLIGGSLFIAILLFGFRQGWRLWRGVRLRKGRFIHRPELLAGLSAFLVSATFLSHAYFAPVIAVVALATLSVGAVEAEKRWHRAVRAAQAAGAPAFEAARGELRGPASAARGP